MNGSPAFLGSAGEPRETKDHTWGVQLVAAGVSMREAAGCGRKRPELARFTRSAVRLNVAACSDVAERRHRLIGGLGVFLVRVVRGLIARFSAVPLVGPVWPAGRVVVTCTVGGQSTGLDAVAAVGADDAQREGGKLPCSVTAEILESMNGKSRMVVGHT